MCFFNRKVRKLFGLAADKAIPIGATAPIGKKAIIIFASLPSAAIGLASKEAIPIGAIAPIGKKGMIVCA